MLAATPVHNKEGELAVLAKICGRGGMSKEEFLASYYLRRTVKELQGTNPSLSELTLPPFVVHEVFDRIKYLGEWNTHGTIDM